MGVFSKLAFWKKKDDLDFGKDLGPDLGLGPMDNSQMGRDLGFPPQQGTGDFGFDDRNLGMPDDTGFGTMGNQPQRPMPPHRVTPMQQPFGAPLQPPEPIKQDYGYGKDLEVVSAKLDSIRYTLDSISQRLANLERLAYGEEEKRRW